jgi:uncharacterized protein
VSVLRLTVHDDASGFAAAAESFLRQSEAEYSMIAAPVARMATAPNEDDAACYLATVHDAHDVVAVAFHGGSGGVLLTAAPNSAVVLIAQDLARRGREPTYAVGPLAACEGFARAWHQQTGQVHTVAFHLRHFELTGSPVFSTAPGSLRLPETDEHELIANWQIDFIKEAGLPDEGARVRRIFARRIERGLVRVWDHEGAVAFVGFGDGPDATARVAPVYTLPGFRGRGYASAMVGELTRELFAAGKRAIYLTTDVANPTSNAIYERIGFRPVADHYHFEFGKAPP